VQVPDMPHEADPLLDAAFHDDFDRDELGRRWRALTPGWAIDSGELCGEAAKNRGVWLRKRLPVNARISFDARPEATDGDIKAEVWGDGHSGATGTSYDDATSYIVIFGGWHNSRHVLARLNEHGDDAMVSNLFSRATEPVKRPVVRGQTYRFTIERKDGQTVRWLVDDMLVHELRDAKPLTGPGHDHFGFNNWMARVCFDNLEIRPD